RPGGLAAPSRQLGRRRLGEPLVAGRAARVRPAACSRREEYLTPLRERTFSVWQGQVHMRVLSKGDGPAVVFFHGPWGLTWDPFLDELARSFTVHAPEHPGTTPGAPDEIYHLDGLWDLVVCYEEVLEGLGVAQEPAKLDADAGQSTNTPEGHGGGRAPRARYWPHSAPAPAACPAESRDRASHSSLGAPPFRAPPIAGPERGRPHWSGR